MTKLAILVHLATYMYTSQTQYKLQNKKFIGIH